MMRWLALVLLLLPGPSAAQSAQSVQVTSGEHGGFTRLVLERPLPGPWRLSRTADGYRLALPSPSRFDLSRVFDRIDRDRLAAIRIDPTDGALLLTVVCRCHALPFEFRPDMLVIDLRDGAPPPGSSFEQGPDGADLPPLSGQLTLPNTPTPVARPRVFDWTRIARDQVAPQSPFSAAPPAEVPPTDLAALRDALWQGFGRAASQGLIIPADPPHKAKDLLERGDPAATNLRLGDLLTARTALDTPEQIATDGLVCPSPERLAIEAWGDDRPAAVQIAASANMVGEFDTPEPDIVARAIRLHLHLGFGAEAEALLRAFPTENPDNDLWRSMARLVDGHVDPNGPFVGLAACDGPTALWSVLATLPDIPAGVDLAAVIRSYSRLPANLRRHLGPPLAEAFLAADDFPTAKAILEALLRLPGEPDDRTLVTAARIALARGGEAEASLRLDSVLGDPGPSQLPALVALVDLHVTGNTPLDPSTAQELSAHLAEAEGTAHEPELRRALVLAQALSGDFAAAFATVPDAPQADADLWRILSQGPDSAVILHAIGASPLPESADTRQSIADRLLALGFVTEAGRWAPSGIAVLPATDDPLHRVIRARDWAELPEDAPEHWSALVDRLAPAVPGAVMGGDTGDVGGADTPLARSRRIAEESAATQAAIQALLSELPDP